MSARPAPKRPSQAAEAFMIEEFYVDLEDDSTLQLSPGSAGLSEAMPRPLTHSIAHDSSIVTGVEDIESWQPMKFVLVLPGQHNQTGLPVASVFTETLTVGLRLYQRNRRRVLTLPPFALFRWHTYPTKPNHCRGEYEYLSGRCTERQVADSVCLKIRALGHTGPAGWAADAYGGATPPPCLITASHVPCPLVTARVANAAPEEQPVD